MKSRYRMIRRGERGCFYCIDTHSGKRTSLQTSDEDSARQIIDAKNQAERQPSLNRQIAKAYLSGTDSRTTTRTWKEAFASIMESQKKENKDRWERAVKDKAFGLIRDRVIVETTSEHLRHVLKAGTVSTNVFLRRIHNFCIDMNWLPWPILPKRLWPAVRFGKKRAITLEEHERIVEREKNQERKLFYLLAWHLGASQSDLANLRAENVNWNGRVINYRRQKTEGRDGTPPQIRFGAAVEEILAQLPKSGPFFPTIAKAHEKHRAAEFKRRCEGLGIKGITLHSYRYAWAERAEAAGYPERFSQVALGHNSKAVHRAYARQAQVTIPPLEDYERLQAERKIISFETRTESPVAAIV